MIQNTISVRFVGPAIVASPAREMLFNGVFIKCNCCKLDVTFHRNVIIVHFEVNL